MQSPSPTRPVRRPALLSALAALLAALPAGAQTGGQTDVPIAPPPGGVGGSFLGAGPRFENELLVRSADRWSFRNDRAACAVRTAERAWADGVAAAPRTPGEQRVDALLRGGDPGEVARALGGGDDARDLAEALDGLFDHPGGCEAGPDGFPEATRWGRAIDAYREYLSTAPDAALSPPPDELLAIHDLLSSVIRRALADIRSGG